MRRGVFVTIRYVSKNPESHAQGELLTTIPQEYRPIVDVINVAYAGSSAPANFNVQANGQIRVWGSGTNYWRFTVTYPAAN